MERWLEWDSPDGKLMSIMEELTTDESLDVDLLSVSQIEHLIESIQYEGLDSGRWHVSLYYGGDPWDNYPTSGLINYLVAILWLKARQWLVTWCTKSWGLEVSLTPPDGGY